MKIETTFPLDDIPIVTSLDTFTESVLQFERGRIGQRELMERLFALGLPAGAIRWLAAYPGRTMMVREDDVGVGAD